jgi:hypothetical protein
VIVVGTPAEAALAAKRTEAAAAAVTERQIRVIVSSVHSRGARSLRGVRSAVDG